MLAQNTCFQISCTKTPGSVTCSQFLNFPLQMSWNQYEMITFKIYTIYFEYFLKCIFPSSNSTYGSFIELLQSGTSVIAIAITLFGLTVVKQNNNYKSETCNYLHNQMLRYGHSSTEHVKSYITMVLSVDKISWFCGDSWILL